MFSIYLSLPEVLNIYNNNIHSSTRYKPSMLFKTTDKKIIKDALKNIKNSQKKFKEKNNAIEPNSKCLLCTNFLVKEKTIKKKIF